MSCPVCESARLSPFLSRRRVPVHQNLPLPSREAARATTRGDLELTACDDCGFVTNQAFDGRLLEYGAEYDNDQSCSTAFEHYVDGLIETILQDGIRRKTVLEIGCGKGYFLTRLCARGDNRGIGVDATYVGPEEELGGRVRFVRQLYDGAVSVGRPDAIVCRHVIEHVPDPLQLLRSARAGADQGAPVRLYFETPDLRWILENGVIQDFFYEHCSYFTADSLALAFRRARLTPTRVASVFSGQYLWMEADGTPPPPEAAKPAGLRPLLDLYSSRERKTLGAARRTLEELHAAGRTAVWGAGAKGVTFLNLVDPDGVLVDCVVDVNPRKQGRFLPGTGHPIVGPESLPARGTREIVLMNPNYEHEVRSLLAGIKLQANLRAGHWS